MSTEKPVIAIVAGGDSGEYDISVKSAAVVKNHLDRTILDTYLVIIKGKDWNLVTDDGLAFPVDKDNFTVELPGRTVRFDGVFIAVHGTPGEDGKLQGYFDMLKIPYNCCGVLQAALTFDKLRCKEYLAAFGVRTGKGVLLKREDWKKSGQTLSVDLPLPVFVKPNKNGSSYGAAKVSEAADLAPAIANAFNYDDEILVEEYLKGTEVTCGVIRVNGKITALPITEIRSKSEFFDYKAKYEGASQEVTPAEIDRELALKIQQTSAAIYEKLDFKGMCRIDYIIRGNEYFMLEVNSIPGLSEESIVPQQAKAYGLTLEELFGNSIEECITAVATATA